MNIIFLKRRPITLPQRSWDTSAAPAQFVDRFYIDVRTQFSGWFIDLNTVVNIYICIYTCMYIWLHLVPRSPLPPFRGLRYCPYRCFWFLLDAFSCFWLSLSICLLLLRIAMLRSLLQRFAFKFDSATPHGDGEVPSGQRGTLQQNRYFRFS